MRSKPCRDYRTIAQCPSDFTNRNTSSDTISPPSGEESSLLSSETSRASAGPGMTSDDVYDYIRWRLKLEGEPGHAAREEVSNAFSGVKRFLLSTPIENQP
jgi:hypothetical protein